MKLTIVLDDNSSQTLHMDEKALMFNDKRRKTPQEITDMCFSIAYDMKHNYKSIIVS